MRKFPFTTSTLVVFALLAGACGADVIEVEGTWTTDFGPIVITAEKWDTTTIVKVDNEANVAYVQSPANDEYSPNKFAKYVWTEPASGSFFYCTVDYGLDTLEAAEASSKTADASKPAESGCGGEFPWTKMTAASTDG